MLQWQTGTFLPHIVDRLRYGLDVRDRVYRLKTYKACFVAREAVDFMLRAGLAESQEEAIQLGRLLETKCDLWHHVCNDHAFKDEYLFFRFSDNDNNNVDNKGSMKTVRAGMVTCVKNVTNRRFPSFSPPKKNKNRITFSGTTTKGNRMSAPPKRESGTEATTDLLSEDGDSSSRWPEAC
jgi:hypothetical protein